MHQYDYSSCPLEDNSIRLLRLMPSKDEAGDIECQLFSYSLEAGQKPHLYEALSYVWGDRGESVPIVIDEHRFNVTENLYAALLRLRDHLLDRIIWVDAICINQADNREKERQIQSMATIYGHANCVIVWLGKTECNSDRAIEAIRFAAGKSTKYTNDETNQRAILALLEREWFRRIWVLQEVAAARHILIICGSTDIDGHAFCLGLELMKDLYKARPDLQGLIHSVTYILRGAIFRPRYTTSMSGRASLEICPLGELVDMYHTHRATIPQDKVYALLGMSSDDPSAAGLLPDYTVSWKELFQRLVKYLLCKEVSVETWCDTEIAVIKSRGCILGRVSLSESNVTLDGRQKVNITFKNTLGQTGHTKEEKVHWVLHASAKSIQDGDLICLLQGASKPTIIRLCEDHFAIIMVGATPPEDIRLGSGYIKWSELLQSAKSVTHNFLLAWDWENSPNDGILEYSKTEFKGQLDKANRTLDVALILQDLGEYKKAEGKLREAEEKLREATEGCGIAVGEEHPHTMESQYGQTPLPWVAGNGCNEVVRLLLADDSVDPDLRDSQYKRTPLSWAARNGHEAVVKLLLETGKVDVNLQDANGMTPLSHAARNGHEAVAKLLLETGKVDINLKTSSGETPLSQAVESGHKAVVKLLLKTGKVDVDLQNLFGSTPLFDAAGAGHEAIVKLLLETGKVDVNFKTDSGRTPLSQAVEGGHEAVVKLLLKTSEVDVDPRSQYISTPLSQAACRGDEAIVKLLLETGKVNVDSQDVNGVTPLLHAVYRGNEAIVKLLLETGKVNVNAKDFMDQTPLSLAVSDKHEAVIKLLLETGKVHVDSKDLDRRTPL